MENLGDAVAALRVLKKNEINSTFQEVQNQSNVGDVVKQSNPKNIDQIDAIKMG
tara:strand:- start:19422 stop:19583 length:162 start_codon:yes stop_codon:yes gene_type:complete